MPNDHSALSSRQAALAFADSPDPIDGAAQSLLHLVRRAAFAAKADVRRSRDPGRQTELQRKQEETVATLRAAESQISNLQNALQQKEHEVLELKQKYLQMVEHIRTLVGIIEADRPATPSRR